MSVTLLEARREALAMRAGLYNRESRMAARPARPCSGRPELLTGQLASPRDATMKGTSPWQKSQQFAFCALPHPKGELLSTAEKVVA